jgi:hypothetical protein
VYSVAPSVTTDEKPSPSGRSQILRGPVAGHDVAKSAAPVTKFRFGPPH